MSAAPNRRAERALWDAGFAVVVGIDEVGKGAWAGPLTVGAAVLPAAGRVLGVRDSKMLSEAKREGLYDRLQAWCSAWSVGHASQEECDRLGMAAAQRLAARRAIDALGVTPDAAIVDGKWNFMSGLVPHVEMVVKADATCLPVSVASVLAKVTRDRIMRSESQHYPQYHFDDNKGYPCPRHRAALAGYGPSAIHRRSWVFMDKLPFTGVERLAPGGQGSLFS
jgi:ribonuclease HII